MERVVWLPVTDIFVRYAFSPNDEASYFAAGRDDILFTNILLIDQTVRLGGYHYSHEKLYF